MEKKREIKHKDLGLVRALQKDFHALYVKEFTMGWKEYRFIRDIELGVMSLENTEKYINKLLSNIKENEEERK